MIGPTGRVSGTVCLPGSKSLTQRALIIAALALGESELKGALICEDTKYLMAALEDLGARVFWEYKTLKVIGTGGRLLNPGRDIYIGDNGTALRLLTSLLCFGSGSYRLTGTKRLCERPMAPLIRALRDLGADVQSESGNGYAPIVVHAQGLLSGGKVKLSATESSQYVSSLLISGPLMKKGLALEVEGSTVSRPYLELTLQMMRAFGTNVYRESQLSFRVPPTSGYSATSLHIEGDMSSGSYFLAAAALCGGRVRVNGVGHATLQGDKIICEILKEMGCLVTMGDSWIEVEGRPLRPGDLVLDLQNAPDIVPTVAVLAAVRPGLTRIVRVSHLRFKESDRLAVLARELSKLGVEATQTQDGLLIRGGGVHGGQINPQGDHRIAMSFGVLALRVPGIVIQDPGCVAKSYPGFWEDLRRLCTP